MKTQEAKELLLVKPRSSLLSKECALSTGSTLLNLACTDHPFYGFSKGAYYYLVGDSTSGKTWLTLSLFAEACRNPAFKDYRLIHDDVEGGALMDVEFYFGKQVAERMEPPDTDSDGAPRCSDTVESFYYNITEAIDAGRPFIYILDSQDALESKAAEKKFDELKKAMRSGKEVKGSYGDGKAKFHSEHLRHVQAGLRRTGSILLITGQTRDNIDQFSFEKKTRAGGKALRFYANLEIWTSVGKKIKRIVREKPRTVGVRCLAEVRKNRVTGKVGKERSVEIPIYYNLGIDDVGSCVDYLLGEKHWTEKKQIIAAKEFEFQGTRSALIAHIEKTGAERRLAKLTGQVWQDIEQACAPQRKRRYA